MLENSQLRKSTEKRQVADLLRARVKLMKTSLVLSNTNFLGGYSRDMLHRPVEKDNKEVKRKLDLMDDDGVPY